MNALLAQFIPEARELLEVAGTGMLQLEKSHSPEAPNDIFRAVHESEIVDGLLDSLDLVGHWIDALESRDRLPDDAESMMSGRVAGLRRWLAGEAATHPVRAAEAAPSDAPAWVANLLEAARRAAYREAAGGALTAWRYAPDDACFFRGDDPAHLARTAPGLVAVRSLVNAFPAAANLDPFACLIRFEALSAATVEAVADHLRYVPEQTEVTAIRAADLAMPTGRSDASKVFADFAGQAAALISGGDRAGLARAARSLLAIVAEGTLQASSLRWIVAVVEAEGDDETLLRLAAQCGPLPAPRPAPRRDDVASRLVAAQAKVLATPAEPGVGAGRLEAVLVVLRRCLPLLGSEAGALGQAIDAATARGDPAPLLAVLAPREPEGPAAGTPPAAELPSTNPTTPRPAAEPRAAEPADAKVLRVEQAKVDALMNFVAELTVAKNGLAYLAGRIEQVSGSRRLGREIKEQSRSSIASPRASRSASWRSA